MYFLLIVKGKIVLLIADNNVVIIIKENSHFEKRLIKMRVFFY
jgi:hypothetical protein